MASRGASVRGRANNGVGNPVGLVIFSMGVGRLRFGSRFRIERMTIAPNQPGERDQRWRESY